MACMYDMGSGRSEWVTDLGIDLGLKCALRHAPDMLTPHSKHVCIAPSCPLLASLPIRLLEALHAVEAPQTLLLAVNYMPQTHTKQSSQPSNMHPPRNVGAS